MRSRSGETRAKGCVDLRMCVRVTDVHECGFVILSVFGGRRRSRVVEKSGVLRNLPPVWLPTAV